MNKDEYYLQFQRNLPFILDIALSMRSLFKFTHRKFNQFFHSFISCKKNRYIFAILCVKRPEYVMMAIDNCNSLHMQNPSHTVYLYCDTVSYQEFRKLRHLLDYPKQVIAKDLYGFAPAPWQTYKIEALIDASLKHRVLVDADSLWHADPVIDANVVTFLVLNYQIHDNKEESELMQRMYPHTDWNDIDHFATGFVSIPKKFMTKSLQATLRRMYANIRRSVKNESLVRLVDELSINCAIQSCIPKSMIRTLKATDGPMDTTIVQSLYYGCSNHITK